MKKKARGDAANDVCVNYGKMRDIPPGTLPSGSLLTVI